MTEYRTKNGSTVTVDGEKVAIAFDWLEEGGCYDCTPFYETGDSYLRWECTECGGGSAALIRYECATEEN